MTDQKSSYLRPLGGHLKVYAITRAFTDQTRSARQAGQVVIFRKNAGRPNVYETVYDALRSRLEIKARYGTPRNTVTPRGELGDLTYARRELAYSLARLSRHYHDPGFGLALEGSLGMLAGLLKSDSNVSKAEARVKAKAGVVKSRTGKINPGANEARLRAIDSRLASRQDEVACILPWISAMETALLLELERNIEVVEHVLGEAGSLSDRSPDLGERIGELSAAVEDLAVEPFLSWRVRFVKTLRSASASAKAGRVKDALIHLGAVRSLCRLVLLQKELESLRAWVAVSLVISGDVTAVGGFCRRLRDIVTHFQSAARDDGQALDPETRRSLKRCDTALVNNDLARAKDLLKEVSQALSR